jgi:hypothetical protein
MKTLCLVLFLSQISMSQAVLAIDVPTTVTLKKMCIPGSPGACGEGNGGVGGVFGGFDGGMTGGGRSGGGANRPNLDERNNIKKEREEIKLEKENAKLLAKSNVKLSKEDIDVLRMITANEKRSNYVNGLLGVGVLHPLITTDVKLVSQILFTVNLAQLDLKELSRAMATWNKITVCTNREIISMRIEGGPDSIEFWEKLLEAYPECLLH